MKGGVIYTFGEYSTGAVEYSSDLALACSVTQRKISLLRRGMPCVMQKTKTTSGDCR
jgi:hypothetical protein